MSRSSSKGHVLILGATADIGEAIAYRFAKAGHAITLAGRQSERLQPLQQDLQIKHHVEVAVVEFDALAYAAHELFYLALPHTPEIVVCVFGYLGDQMQARSDWQETERILHTNFTGAVSILNVVANDFEARKTGTIIGISSVAGDRGRQSNYTYGSAKAGFNVYLAGLRNRLYHSGGHVVNVKPGFVDTKMTDAMPLPPIITAKAHQVAKATYKAYRRRSNTIYTLWMWRYIMRIIKSIPETIFKRLKL